MNWKDELATILANHPDTYMSQRILSGLNGIRDHAEIIEQFSRETSARLFDSENKNKALQAKLDIAVEKLTKVKYWYIPNSSRHDEIDQTIKAINPVQSKSEGET